MGLRRFLTLKCIFWQSIQQSNFIRFQKHITFWILEAYHLLAQHDFDQKEVAQKHFFQKQLCVPRLPLLSFLSLICDRHLKFLQLLFKFIEPFQRPKPFTCDNATEDNEGLERRVLLLSDAIPTTTPQSLVADPSLIDDN